jgi:hypothetical protein
MSHLVFSPQVFTLIFCPMPAKYPAHHIYNSVTLMVFGEDITYEVPPSVICALQLK